MTLKNVKLKIESLIPKVNYTLYFMFKTILFLLTYNITILLYFSNYGKMHHSIRLNNDTELCIH